MYWEKDETTEERGGYTVIRDVDNPRVWVAARNTVQVER